MFKKSIYFDCPLNLDVGFVRDFASEKPYLQLRRTIFSTEKVMVLKDYIQRDYDIYFKLQVNKQEALKKLSVFDEKP